LDERCDPRLSAAGMSPGRCLPNPAGELNDEGLRLLFDRGKDFFKLAAVPE
jgi:hypothetical protein